MSIIKPTNQGMIMQDQVKQEYHVDVHDRHGDHDFVSVWATSPEAAKSKARHNPYGDTVYENQTPVLANWKMNIMGYIKQFKVSAFILICWVIAYAFVAESPMGFWKVRRWNNQMQQAGFGVWCLW